MHHKLFLFLAILLFCSPAFSRSGIESIKAGDTIQIKVADESLNISSDSLPHRSRFVSAVLAFPFPFGFIGAHRVMLGCKPWVPVVYVATFGGCFGIIPLIDFCAIVFSRDIRQYENNPNLFMWIE